MQRMTPTVTVAAVVTQLTTKTAFKLMQGISDTDSDAKIDRMIDGATASIQAETNRLFYKQTYSEQIRSIRSADLIALARYPVITITSVTADSVVLDPTAYEIDKENGFLYRLDNDSRQLWSAQKLVVVYSAGYLLPAEAGRTLPPDIEDACLEQVKAVWFSGTRDPLVKGEEVPGVGRQDFWVGQVGDNAALCPQALDRIDKYRDYRF